MSAPEKFIFAPRDSKSAIEQGFVFAPKFDGHGLIAAIAIDFATHEPLMLAYMNEEALKKTLEIGEAVYFSRSRQELWHKGATSGHVQKIKEIRVDCDQDALILYVEQLGAGACHTGHKSCFFRSVAFGSNLANLADSQQVVPLSQADDGPVFDANSVYGEK